MELRTFNLYTLIVCSVLCVECTYTPIVRVSTGRVRGRRSVSGQNRYYGIPYAQAQRFQPPQEPPKWRGVLDAVDRFAHCAQRVAFLTLGKEDCLQLDVYTPEKPSNNPLPVLVFIHGGAYYYGSKAHYDPEFLVTKNVIVVVINYRVGVLGFLCANGIANLGLKDQVAALKWIKKNIAAFGGDPDNVTLSGQSAGASAAAMHLLSNKSKGLFHKVILMSGNPFTPWAFNVEPLVPALEDANKIRKVSTEAEVIDVFSNATVTEIMEACKDVSTNPRFFKYSPCVDSNFEDPFFHDTPYNIITSGNFSKLPMIVGYADVEGMLFYGLNNENTFKEWNNNFIDRLPSLFSRCSKEEKEIVARKVRSHYFGNKTIDRKSVKEVVNFYSDWIAYATSDAFVDLIGQYSMQPVYKYMFSYEGDRNFAKFIFGLSTGMEGASHSDDIFYVFKPAGLSLLLSKGDRLFIDRLTAMITNFMKFGNPTPASSRLVRWPPGPGLTLRLGSSMQLLPTPLSHRGEFFLQMLCTHGVAGYAPCLSNHTINDVV